MNPHPHCERRTLDTAIADVGLEERDGGLANIRGYAAMFYDGTPRTEFVFGQFRERVLPGAFDRAIREGQDVRALFNHNPDQVLGRLSAKTLKLLQDDRGLRYSIDTPNTTVGRDLVENLRRGDVTGSSFAFSVRSENWKYDEGETIVRELVDLDLFDVGPVTFPAYAATEAGLRSLGAALAEWEKQHGPLITPVGAARDLLARALDLAELE